MKGRFLLYVVVVLMAGVFTHAEAGGHGGRGFGGRGFVSRGFGGRGFRHEGFFPDFVVGVGDPYYYPYYPYYGYDDYGPEPAAYAVTSNSHSSVHESMAVQVQRILAQQGYYHGDIDGIIGPQSRAAIVAYQQKHGLDQSGIIDATLLKSLQL